jgi:hypothetical protein
MHACANGLGFDLQFWKVLYALGKDRWGWTSDNYKEMFRGIYMQARKDRPILTKKVEQAIEIILQDGPPTVWEQFPRWAGWRGHDYAGPLSPDLYARIMEAAALVRTEKPKDKRRRKRAWILPV